MKGRPISEAPRDGTEIIAETMRYFGVPETGHYKFERLVFQKHGGIMGNLSGWNERTVMDSILDDGCVIQWWPANTPKSQLEKTPRTNWNYRPSNGTEGDCFYTSFCERCIHERPMRDDYEKAVANGLGCDIYARTMAHKISDAEYPTEWTYDRQTGEPKCTAFELDVGDQKPTQEPRCTQTLELFPETK